MIEQVARSRAETDFRGELIGLLPHLRAFARGLCGRSDYADDLVQETVIKAWTAQQRFKPGTNMRAWLFTIMRNHFINDRRRSAREAPYDDDTAVRLLVEDPQQENRVHLTDMESALGRLPHEQREALLLVGASGFSYEQAAEICGVAIGTMKSRVSRGRAALTASLGGPGGSSGADGSVRNG